MLSNGTQSDGGGLIKITKNTSYRWTFNCGPGANTREELLGTWAMLYLASRLHIETLHIFGDSIIIIECLNNREIYKPSPFCLGRTKFDFSYPLSKNSSSIISIENITNQQINYPR
jgi:hypothetical protein